MSAAQAGGEPFPANHRAGVLLMATAMLMLPGIDAIAKQLAGHVSPTQIAWFRLSLQALLLLPFVLREGSLHSVRHPGLHALRGALIAATTVQFFAAVAVLPLAEAISIFFIEPLLLVVLSAVFLGERIGWRRIAAVLFGFIGVLLVQGPSFNAFGPAALLPLGAAFTFTLYLLITRHLAQRQSPLLIQFTSGASGFAFMSIALLIGEFVIDWPPLDYAMPTRTELLLLTALAVIATVGHVMIVQAFRHAPASLLAPLQYLEIAGATALGFIFFDQLPGATATLGIAIIVATGVYIGWRAYVAEKPRAAS